MPQTMTQRRNALLCSYRVILLQVKTAVSLPDDVYARAERIARRLGRTRSALYAEALREYLDRHEQEQLRVTALLDEVYRDDAQEAAAGAAAARRLVVSGAWEW
jgi:predicted transcriptional regulator